MGLHAAKGVGVVLQRRQEIQQARGGCAALRPNVEGERQTAGLHPPPQYPERQGEVHQDRGAACGEVAGMARGGGGKGVDYGG